MLFDSMNLQLLTLETSVGYKILGLYLTKQLASLAASQYVTDGEIVFKKKLVRKNNIKIKKLMYEEDSREDTKKSIFITQIPCDFAQVAKKKKSSSAFILFSIDHRARVKALHPSSTFAEISRIVGNEWNVLSADAKNVYSTRANGTIIPDNT